MNVSKRESQNGAHKAKILTMGATHPKHSKKGRRVAHTMTQPTQSPADKAHGANPNNGKLQGMPDDETKHVPLTDIYVDPSWNGRTNANALSTSETLSKEDAGFFGLLLNIVENGQDTPVDVRTISEGFYKKDQVGKKPYALVTGFRRFAAVNYANQLAAQKSANEPARTEAMNPEDHRMLIDAWKTIRDRNWVAIPNTANGTIRATPRGKMIEFDARRLNARENTERDDLTPPDLMWTIAELKKQSEAANGGQECSSYDLSDMTGKAQGYVSKLLRISALPRPILDHWRNGGKIGDVTASKSLSTEDLLSLTKIEGSPTPEALIKRYQEMLTDKGVSSDSGKKGKQWLEAAKAKASAVGHTIGLLQRDGFLALSKRDKAPGWLDVLDTIVKLPKNEQAKKIRNRQKIADAAEKGYQAGLAEEPETEEDDDDGEE